MTVKFFTADNEPFFDRCYFKNMNKGIEPDQCDKNKADDVRHKSVLLNGDMPRVKLEIFEADGGWRDRKVSYLGAGSSLPLDKTECELFHSS
ncbi:hypothetical protein T10_2512 [Trichinella papuae]|uniref:Uncharacterized protein n=1 Tax=Trichinella papuae TaxID=268474 RepID=A0A0V1M4V4_9BILA|nr:hypothetical protein T10_2512 [Trichinella papuae]